MTSPPIVEQTQACVRCGATVPLGTAMCENCNPLGLKQPAASQAHGTVLLGVVAAIVGLALLGRFALGGIGPFQGEVGAIAASPPGLAITLTVKNLGTSAGSANCRVWDPASGADTSQVYVLSPTIGAGQTISFSKEISELGDTVRPLSVECTGP